MALRAEIRHPELKKVADEVTDEPGDYLSRTKTKHDPEGQARYITAYMAVAKDDPVQQGWDKYKDEFRAKTHIFEVMAKAFETELGKEAGREAVHRARIRQGKEMGELMRQKVRAKGGRLSLQNFFNEFWQYFSWSPHVDDERYFDEQGNLVKYVLRQNCWIGEYLAERVDVEFAANYCDIDEYIVTTYNPNVRYHRRHWAGGGDRYSELIWELPTEGIID